MNETKYAEIVKKTAQYPEAGTGVQLSLTYVVLGLGNEAGEVQGVFKKHLRGDRNLDKFADKMLDEAADVVWYLKALCIELSAVLSREITIEYLMEINAEKLLSRLDRGVIKGDGDER